MKVSLFALITGAVLLAAGIPSPAVAQQRTSASAAGPHRIGLVDIGFIFDHYKKLETMRAQLEAEVKAAANDPEIASIKQQIKSIQSQLKKLEGGSQKALELEQKMIEINAKGKARMMSLKREFMRKEARMYRTVYREVANMVRLYAEGQNYTLVIRYHRDAPGKENSANPQQLRAQLNRLVVYHQEQDDMTDRILSYMNQQYAKSQKTASAPSSSSSQ